MEKVHNTYQYGIYWLTLAYKVDYINKMWASRGGNPAKMKLEEYKHINPLHKLLGNISD